MTRSRVEVPVSEIKPKAVAYLKELGIAYSQYKYALIDALKGTDPSWTSRHFRGRELKFSDLAWILCNFTEEPVVLYDPMFSEDHFRRDITRLRGHMRLCPELAIPECPPEIEAWLKEGER